MYQYGAFGIPLKPHQCEHDKMGMAGHSYEEALSGSVDVALRLSSPF
jgi:hypothetical protein